MGLLDQVTQSVSPAMLARLQQAAEPGAFLYGALPGAILALIDQYGVDDASAAALLARLRAGDGPAALDPGGELNPWRDAGAELDATLLQDRLLAASPAFGVSIGLPTHSAQWLLQIALAVALAALQRQTMAAALDASGLRVLLDADRLRVETETPEGLRLSLRSARTAPAMESAAAPARTGAVWPWIVVPMITLALAFTLHNLQQRSPGSPVLPAKATEVRPAG